MRALELKVPPPVVTLLAALAMWGVALVTPPLAVPGRLRAAAAIVLAAGGLASAISAVLAFRRARTTIHPLQPETSSALVTTGIYRVTRNPMYLGLAMLLIAWAALLSSLWALLVLPLFAIYLTRFQIVPEERALAGIFGGDYAAYRARVRRWL